MTTTLFYSWQSDNSSTRSYVEKALKQAAKNISKNPDIESAPRIDKDTQNVAGAVHIVDTIKKKIDSCGIFLADVSLIDTGTTGRALVNQNVMFELGYAIGKHSESRVILVANSDLNDIKELPFDISHHRVIPFSPKSDKKGQKLQTSLETAIQIHMESLERELIKENGKSKKEKLLEAVHNGTPTKSLSRSYFDDLYSRFIKKSPGRYKSGEYKIYAKEVYEAYLSTIDLSLEFHEIVQAASEYKNRDALIQSFKCLRMITQYYDIVPEDGGHLNHISKEYYSLIANEIVNILLGCIIEEELWDIMSEVVRMKLSRPSGYESAIDTRDLQEYPSYVLSYFCELKDRKYYVPISHLLEEKFAGKNDVLKSYIEGDLLRYFINDDYPWSIALVLLSSWTIYLPELPEKFGKPEFVEALWSIADKPDIADFRKKLWEHITRQITDFMMSRYNLSHLFKHYGITREEQIIGETIDLS